MFDLFGRDGLARVVTWLVQSGEASRLEPVRVLLANYIAEASGRSGEGTDKDIARIAMIVTLTAYAEAQAGPLIGGLLGFTGEERRDLLTRMIEPLMQH